MKPVYARLVVLSFLVLFSAISVNALFMQDGRISQHSDKKYHSKVTVQVEKPETKDVEHVASVSKKQHALKPRSKQQVEKRKPKTIGDMLKNLVGDEETSDAPQNSETKNIVALIQDGLLTLGYHPGSADGIAGPTTRAAIMAYEFDRGLVQTGIADAEILEVIRGSKRRPERSTSAKILAKNSQELVSALQKALTKLGYNTGSADGVIGPLTRKRIRSFERDQRMNVTGRISGKLIDAINKARGRPLLLASLAQ